MLIAALGLFFVAIVLVVAQLSSRRPKVEPKKVLEGEVPELYRTFRPIIDYVASLNRMLPLGGIKDWYAHKIDRAGLQFELGPDEFLAIKLVILLVVMVFALLVYTVVLQNWAFVVILVIIGFMLPDVRLVDMVKKRETAYLKSLPGFLDLLALTVEAGLGFDAAIRKLTEVLEPSPLTKGFQTFLRNMSVGKPRVEALRDMARKLDLPDFNSFAHAVIQATESGASMGPVLRIQSSEMRFRRFERAEKRAHETPVKMLLPLFVFVFPATFLMIMGPLYFQFKASGAAGAL